MHHSLKSANRISRQDEQENNLPLLCHVGCSRICEGFLPFYSPNHLTYYWMEFCTPDLCLQFYRLMEMCIQLPSGVHQGSKLLDANMTSVDISLSCNITDFQSSINLVNHLILMSNQNLLLLSLLSIFLAAEDTGLLIKSYRFYQ